MPSAKVLESKQAVVAALTERLKNACAGVIVDYKGINVADDTALRKELRERMFKEVFEPAIKNAGKDGKEGK